MSRISINQTMLLLNEGREVPALMRALPIFEDILTKNNLYSVPPNKIGQSPLRHLAARLQACFLPDSFRSSQDVLTLCSDYASAQPESQGDEQAEIRARSQPSDPWLHLENGLTDISMRTEFLGFDFSNEWEHFGQLDFLS
jgi:hypothetical protein